MKFLGKILGFILSLISRGGFLSVITGIFIGHIFDKLYDKCNFICFSRSAKNEKKEFLSIIFQIIGYIAKSKGIVTKKDIKYVRKLMEYFNFNEKLKNIAKKSFLEGKKFSFPIKEKLKILKNFNLKKEVLTKFIKIQLEIAIINEYLHPNTKKVIIFISNELNIEKEYIDNLIYKFEKKIINNNADINLAYRILGVNKYDNKREIKKAYKKLMSKYHPDKIISKKNISKNIINIYKEKTQLIQKSYNLIRKEKKF
ncbi:MAG: co-chaperone DjlA [Enterobacteriaceae bacterium]